MINRSVYSTMMNSFVKQLNALVDANKRFLLNKDNFDRGLQQFEMGVAQLMQIINNPAIRINDMDNTTHYVVGGEKWKVISAILTEDYIMTTTDPFRVCIDKFETNKEKALECLKGYELTYNVMINKTMLINDQLNAIHSATSNNDKIKSMTAICDVITTAIEEMNTLYGITTESKLPN